MHVILAFYRSTIGKKIIIAATGIVLFSFVVGHLLGNLQIFQGPEKLNKYADLLKAAPEFLWGARFALIASAALHVMATVQLTLLARQSRPVGYARLEVVQASPASRTMIWSGIFVGVFIVYHLLHFTTGTLHPDFQPKDVHANVIVGFSSWGVSAFYIAALIALGFHFYHGVWSVFQTLGVNHPKYNQWRRLFATLAAVGLALGYITIPVSVMTGLVR